MTTRSNPASSARRVLRRSARPGRMPTLPSQVHAAVRSASSTSCSSSRPLAARGCVDPARRPRASGRDRGRAERVSRGSVQRPGARHAGANGVFVFPVRGRAGDVSREAGTASSARVRVAVAPRVGASARGGAIVVSALPARPGSRVAVQVYDRERFTFRHRRPRPPGRHLARGRPLPPRGAGTRPRRRQGPRGLERRVQPRHWSSAPRSSQRLGRRIQSPLAMSLAKTSDPSGSTSTPQNVAPVGAN